MHAKGTVLDLEVVFALRSEQGEAVLALQQKPTYILVSRDS